MRLTSLPDDIVAIVFGASGGIGAALAAELERAGITTHGLHRRSDPAIDLLDEATIAAAAARIAGSGEHRLMIDATGFLHGGGHQPEKALAQIDAAHMAHAFAVNAIGPALLMKHFLPLMPKGGRSVFATLSARVGSIGDNRTGGWFAYRASKAALNQIVRTAAIELHRRRPEAICCALHPGTVDTGLSAPFAKAGLRVRSPQDAATRLLAVVDRLDTSDNGRFFDHEGADIPW
jgi:NAD(P)-dependent dehydrogenase (short-subunit alcohol dehydrogenase family)